MPIPSRFRVQLTADDIEEYTELCNRIENGLTTGNDVSALIEQWNRRAGRSYDPREFTTYYGAVSTETFVMETLMGEPSLVDDLNYAELREVLEAVVACDIDEASQAFYLRWLEANLPGSNVADLIFFPAEWFGNEQLRVELSPDEILGYALRKSGRHVRDAPSDVELEHPIPVDATLITPPPRKS